MFSNYPDRRMSHVTQWLLSTLQALLLYATQLPQDKALAKLQRLMLPLLVSSSSSDAADADLAQVIADALQAATQHSSSDSSAAVWAADRSLSATGPSYGAACATPFSATPAAAGTAGTAAAAAGGSQAELGEEVMELLTQRAVGAAGKIRDFMRGASLVTLAPGE
jgi:hypothetical protein